jgi:uncharacterized protein YdaU (DUF1376 family)
MAQAIPPLGASPPGGAHTREGENVSTSIWYPRYVGDYQRKTSHLSLTEHGAYAMLLDHYYSTGKPIPASAEQVQRICRAFASHEAEAVQSVLNQFFELLEDGYHNKKADKELLKRSSISEKRQKAAYSKHANAHASAEQMHMQVHTQPQPQPHSSNQVSIEAAVAPKAKRASRIDPNWKLSEQGRCYAKDRGLDQTTIDCVAEGFRDHWIASAGKGAVALDWDAKWRTWVNNHLRFTGSQTTAGGQKPQRGNQGAASLTAVRDKIRADLGLLETGSFDTVRTEGDTRPNGDGAGAWGDGLVIEHDAG